MEAKQSKAVHTPQIEDVEVRDTSDVEGETVIVTLLPKRMVSSKTASQRGVRKVKLAGEAGDDFEEDEVVSLRDTIVAEEVDAEDHVVMVKEMPERPPKKMMAPVPATEVDQQLSKNPVMVKCPHVLVGVVVDEVAVEDAASLADFIEEEDHLVVGVEVVTGNLPQEEKNRVRTLRTMRPKNLLRTKINYQLIVYKTRS